MSTLLLRLAAPLQAWGDDAKYENRRGTERVPTKSGVIGLVAAALGRRRDESVEDLCALRFGVRVDREGKLLRDYHTAKSEKAAYVTNRYYLSDAVFLAGLEGNDELLKEIDEALRHPAFPLFLGRRSCPPEGTLSLGIRRGKDLLVALREEASMVGDRALKNDSSVIYLRFAGDADASCINAYYQRDVPLSFDQSHRRFGFRRVCESVLPVASAAGSSAARESLTLHDPMQELEGD